jgi:palmitoyl-protein thioesterase
MRLIALFAIIAINVVATKEVLPILIWHSAFENCCSGETLQYIQFLQSQLGADVYIKSVRIGDTSGEDKLKSLSTHPFKQVDQVCREIRNDERLKDGFNAIGLSQGGLFLRALVQICPHPKIRNLITLASPHQGVYSYPQCSKYFGALCMFVMNSLNNIAYTE